MNTYITHSGTGVEVDEISIKGLIGLVNKTIGVKTKLILALHEKGKNIDDEDLTLEDLECYETPLDIIIECLNEIANSDSFGYVEDDDGYNYILFFDKSPWEYTAREKKFTKQDVVGFLNLMQDIFKNMEIENLYIANYLNN